MPVRFDIDLSDNDAARLAALAEARATTSSRLLAEWLTDLFTGDERLVRDRLNRLLAPPRASVSAGACSSAPVGLSASPKHGD